MIREHYDNEADWLKARNRDFGTGGSDAAVIIGISPFKTVDQLFDEKMGLVKPKDLSKNAAVIRGKEQEPILRADAQQKLQKYYDIEWHPFDILRNEEHPYIFATLDGDVIRKSDGVRGIYEAKTGRYCADAIEAWENGVPKHYFAQNCQQLLATGWSFVIDHAMLATDMNGAQELPVERRFFRYFNLETPGVKSGMAFVKEALLAFHYCCEHQIRPTSHVRWGGQYKS